MTTTSDRLRSFWAERQFDREGASTLVARYWQIALIVALIGFAAGMRFWALGARAIHHDESIHMKFAYDIMRTGVDAYNHDPTYHGPFYYFTTAAFYKFPLFGDNDFTGRLVPALFGIGLVGLPFLLRRQLGIIGAFAAAALLAISPSLTYFSRFARNDAFITFFTLGIVVSIWRYLEDRRDGWLIAIGPMLALSFTAKEMTLITAPIILVFVNFLVAMDLAQQVRARHPDLEPAAVALLYVGFFPIAWLVVALWPLLKDTYERNGLTQFPAAAAPLIVIGTLIGPQYAAGIQELPFLGDDGYMKEGNLIKGTVLVLIILSAYVGLMWNWRVWLLAAGLFYGPYVVLFTSFFTNMGGFWTGMWGSMDYWLGQQDVRRGNQPDYYYFMTLPVYEFLPLVFALGGTLYYAFKGRVEQKLLTAASLLLITLFSVLPDSVPLFGTFHIWIAFFIALGTILILSMETFTKFLLFWTVATLFAITVAGEKMPWLTVHVALPLALLGAKVLNDILSDTVTSKRAEQAGPWPWDRYLPFAYGIVSAFAATVLFVSFGPASPVSFFAWVLAVAAAGSVFWAARTVSLRTAGQVAAVALASALLVFTVRAGANAAFDEGDPDGYPQEMLIYAQGSPKLDIIFSEIERFGSETGLDKDVPIMIDNSGNIWPWPWYLRDYTNVQYHDFSTPPDLAAGTIALVRTSNQANMQELVDDYQQPIPYTHMWWFPEFYRGLEGGPFIRDVIKGDYWSTWRSYFIDREVPGAQSAPDVLAYFPKDASFVVPDQPDVEVPTPPPTPQPPAEAVAIPADQITVHTTGAGAEAGQVNQPAGLALDEEGNLYIVDTLNHRIQRMTADGEFEAYGEQGSGNGEFGNPRSDDYQIDDGPWGVTTDQNGNIYVADTWNHRVQKFNSDGEFEASWGFGNEDARLNLFGPRDLSIDGSGNLLVVDTGNGRVVAYTTDGEFLDDFGGKGTDAGLFDEPTSVAVAPNGDIYVADYWNQRIQRFDSDYSYVDEISVPSWGSQGITDRAYIEVLEDGHILATDPGNGRIIVFDAEGAEESAWRLGEPGTTRPVGITVDTTGRAFISDSLAAQVVSVPVAVLLATADQPPSGE